MYIYNGEGGGDMRMPPSKNRQKTYPLILEQDGYHLTLHDWERRTLRWGMKLPPPLSQTPHLPMEALQVLEGNISHPPPPRLSHQVSYKMTFVHFS